MNDTQKQILATLEAGLRQGHLILVGDLADTLDRAEETIRHNLRSLQLAGYVELSRGPVLLRTASGEPVTITINENEETT